MAAGVCSIVHDARVRLFNDDPLEARLLAGMASLLTCFPVAAAAALAAGQRATAHQLAASGSVAALPKQLEAAAAHLLDFTLTVRAQLAMAVMCTDPHMFTEPGSQVEWTFSRLLSPAAVASFCAGVQHALGGLTKGLQLAAAAPADCGESSGAQAFGPAGSAANAAARQGVSTRLHQYASCLFSMAQLVPAGGPAWHLVDQALSWHGLAAALPGALADAAEGLTASSTFGSDCAVGHTANAHAGCVLLAAAALEAQLRQLQSALEPEQRQPVYTALQQAATDQLWEDLEQACNVALTLCREDASSGQEPPLRLPQTWQCELRVLSAGAALFSLAADASSGSGRGGGADESWQELGASAASDAAGSAAGRWAALLLELTHGLANHTASPALPFNLQVSWVSSTKAHYMRA